MSAKLYRIGNQEKTLPQWAKIYLCPLRTLYWRMSNGWDLLDALTTIDSRPVAMLTVGDVTRTLKGWAKHTGLPLWLIKDRRKRGFSPERCVAPRRTDVEVVTAFGRTLSIPAWAREAKIGIIRSALRYRLLVLGLPPEVALTLPVAGDGKRKGAK